jgi:hypothetical protein
MSPDFLEESEDDEREHEREREHLQQYLFFDIHFTF